ncbi:MAG: family 43 glycosylhydrolase [Clostridia bacterium]|nr:family 43 glycosylhydrolase [Clostridia bacterium]
MNVNEMSKLKEQASCFTKVFEVKGRYVNDHCFFMEGKTVHLFYIDGEAGKGCYDLGNEIIIGHAISEDLIHWREVSPALIRDDRFSHEERGIFAPYVVSHENRYYMYYSSHNMAGAQFMCLAISSDLHRFERYEGNPLFVPRGEYAFWSSQVPCSCRDPHVFRDPISHDYLMYWVCDMKEAKDESCISLSRSSDLFSWTETSPVLVRKHSFDEAYTMKAESPCLIKHHGLYYLFYRHGNGTKYVVSDDYTSFTDSKEVLLGPSHASEIFLYNNEWYISSCSREPADIEHKTDRHHGLYLARLSFETLTPSIIPF